MDKLQFEFTAKPAADGKSNVLCITSITTTEGRTFEIPNELQQASLHIELCKTKTFAKVRNTIKKRHQKRNVWIEMSGVLRDTYIDESGNMQFSDYLLEEITDTKTNTTETTADETLKQILMKLVEKDSNKHQNLRKISEKFTIEKYTTKNANANQWIDTFEEECKRFGITEDREKIETLRHLLDKNSLDWYTSMMLKITINADWNTWKNKFCETYANKGWNPITYALSFKYIEGSLLDYAVKKERLLLEIRKSIDMGTLIDLIAAGLPNYILHKIERESLKETEDLFNELNKHEYLTKRNNLKKEKDTSFRYKEKTNSKQPCKICKQLNKGDRYHSEDTCWFKSKEKNNEKGHPNTQINNSVIEAELISESQQKNE